MQPQVLRFFFPSKLAEKNNEPPHVDAIQPPQELP
jgi:hypothetical protein